MKQKICAALMEKPADEGFTQSDVFHILSELTEWYEDITETEFLPVKVDAHGSTAFGFIRADAAEQIDYKIDQPGDFAASIEAVLNDMELEDPSECYTFCGVRTKLFRNDRPHPDMFQSLCASLSHEAKGEVWTDGEEILCRTKAGADMLVAILSQMYSNRGISFDWVLRPGGR